MSKLPLEELKEKYLPITAFPEKYGISVLRIKRMIDSKQIRYTEFKEPGAIRRTVHVNYEEVLAIVEKEGDESN